MKINISKILFSRSIIVLALLAIFSILISCKKDESQETDNLQEDKSQEELINDVHYITNNESILQLEKSLLFDEPLQCYAREGDFGFIVTSPTDDFYSSLYFLNFSLEEGEEILHSIQIEGNVRDIAIHNGKLYLLTMVGYHNDFEEDMYAEPLEDLRITIVSIENKDIVEVLNTPGEVVDFALFENYLIVVGDEDSQIYQINTSSTELVKSISCSAYSSNYNSEFVKIVNGKAVVMGFNSLYIIDLMSDDLSVIRSYTKSDDYYLSSLLVNEEYILFLEKGYSSKIHIIPTFGSNGFEFSEYNINSSDNYQDNRIGNIRNIYLKKDMVYINGEHNNFILQIFTDKPPEAIDGEFLWNDSSDKYVYGDYVLYNRTYSNSDTPIHWSLWRINKFNQIIPQVILYKGSDYSANYSIEDGRVTCFSKNDTNEQYTFESFVINEVEEHPEGLSNVLEVKGAFGFLAGVKTGLRTVDFSNPIKPRVVNSINPDFEGEISDVIWYEDILSIVSGKWIFLFDVSSPVNPILLSKTNTFFKIHKQALYENILFIANDIGGLRIMDISDPLQPLTLRLLPGFDNESYLQEIIDLKISDEGVYYSMGTAFCFSSFDDLMNDQDFLYGNNVTPDIQIHALKDKLMFYTHSNLHGIGVMEVKSNGVKEISELALSGDILKLTVRGDYAFITSQNAFYIVDISTPEELKLLKTVDYPPFVNVISHSIEGEYCYLLDNKTIIQILYIGSLGGFEESLDDIVIGDSQTDDFFQELYPFETNWDIPGSLVIGNILNFTNGHLKTVAVEPYQEYIFIGRNSSSDNEIIVIDRSDLENPIEAAVWQPKFNENEFSHLSNVVLSDEIGYISFEKQGILIVDFTIPTEPVAKSFLPMDNICKVFKINQNTLYVADLEKNISIIDISDREDPITIENLNTPGAINDIAVQDDFAFLTGEGNSAIIILDIVDAQEPEIITIVEDSYSEFSNILVSENNVYLKLDADFFIFNIEDKLNPYKMENKIEGERVTAWGLALLGSYLIAVDEEICVIDVSDTDNPKIVNKFVTTISHNTNSFFTRENVLYLFPDYSSEMNIVMLPE